MYIAHIPCTLNPSIMNLAQMLLAQSVGSNARSPFFLALSCSLSLSLSLALSRSLSLSLAASLCLSLLNSLCLFLPLSASLSLSASLCLQTWQANAISASWPVNAISASVFRISGQLYRF